MALPVGNLTRNDLVAMREKLFRARVSGLRKVKTGEDEIEYRSDQEMAAAIADLDRLIAAFDPPKHWLNNGITITSHKGL